MFHTTTEIKEVPMLTTTEIREELYSLRKEVNSLKEQIKELTKELAKAETKRSS